MYYKTLKRQSKVFKRNVFMHCLKSLNWFMLNHLKLDHTVMFKSYSSSPLLILRQNHLIVADLSIRQIQPL